MKLSTKIFIFQMLTVATFLLTVMSVGAVLDESLFATIAKSGFFYMLTKEFFNKSNELYEKRERIRQKRRMRVYNNKSEKAA